MYFEVPDCTTISTVGARVPSTRTGRRAGGAGEYVYGVPGYSTKFSALRRARAARRSLARATAVLSLVRNQGYTCTPDYLAPF